MTFFDIAEPDALPREIDAFFGESGVWERNQFSIDLFVTLSVRDDSLGFINRNKLPRLGER